MWYHTTNTSIIGVNINFTKKSNYVKYSLFIVLFENFIIIRWVYSVKVIVNFYFVLLMISKVQNITVVLITLIDTPKHY